MPKPLEGIRVVELARVLAGPWCGQLLADLGAEVVKVERPGAGDDTREWGPPFVTGADGEALGAAYYHSCNRGKRSVAIDIASPKGQAEVRALLADADVVIENYKVGGLVKYGLDPARLRADFPRLVVCSITGFGQTGPYAHRAGYDYIVQAMSGFMSLTGEPDGAPQKAGIAYADIFTGMYSAVAILAALRRRDVTNMGAHVDMALLDSQVAVLANQAANYLASGVAPKRMGNAHANVVPYQVFATADGQLVIAVGNDGQYRKLCAVLGVPEWGDDPRFANNAMRLANRPSWSRCLRRRLRRGTRSRCRLRLRPRVCLRGRSMIWRRCSPIRRLLRAGCASGPRARQSTASRARSSSTASVWFRPAARRRWAADDRKLPSL